MTVHEVKLFDKWMTLQGAGVEKSDIFEIIDKDESMMCDTHINHANLEELPPEFFDFFMVIKAS